MTSEQDTGNGARLPPTGPWNTLEAAAVLADYTGPLYGGMMLPPEVARYWQEIIAYCEMTGRNWMTDLLSYQELLDYAQWRGLTPDLFRLADPDPGEPDRPEQGAAAKRTALESLLTEIDLRAKKAGAGFNRRSLPGTKDEFARLLKAYCPEFRHIGTARIADYMKGACRFQPGAKPEQGKGAAVWALFPECDLKLG